MGLVALASIKGAPGVTTASLALAAAWPSNRSAVVAELDPAGGDIAAWRSLPPEPSVVTLAAAMRRGQPGGSTSLVDHCQELPGGLRVLCGSPSPVEMGSAVDVITDGIAQLSMDAGVDVLCDCGRISWTGAAVGRDSASHSPSNSVGRVIRRTDVLVVLTRAQLADLSHLDACLPALRSMNDCLGLLLVGPVRWSGAEIAAQFGVEVVGHLPHDPVGADIVGGRAARGGVRRLPLLRAARAVADRIATALPAARQSVVLEESGLTEPTGIAASVEAIP